MARVRIGRVLNGVWDALRSSNPIETLLLRTDARVFVLSMGSEPSSTRPRIAALAAVALLLGACRETPPPPPPPAPTATPAPTPVPTPSPAPESVTASGWKLRESVAGIGDPVPAGGFVRVRYKIIEPDAVAPSEEGVLDLEINGEAEPALMREALAGVRLGAKRTLEVPATELPLVKSGASRLTILLEVDPVAPDQRQDVR